MIYPLLGTEDKAATPYYFPTQSANIYSPENGYWVTN